jgi:hypothetical protein
MMTSNAARFPNLFDRLGILTAGGCIVHCLLVPILLLAAPGLVSEIFENEAIHILLACAALFFITTAVARGYQNHKSFIPAVLGSLGMTLIWGSLLIEDRHWLEQALTTIGALSMAMAHMFNHRLSHLKRSVS